jgi:hypothetical protein
MNELLHNFLQITAAVFLLSILAAPTGYLLLRLLGIRANLPVSILLGLVVLPFYLNLLGSFAPLILPIRLILLLILNGLLFALLKRKKMNHLDAEKKHEDFQSLKVCSILLLIAFAALLITLFPLLLHEVPIEERWYYIMAGDWIKHIGIGNGMIADDRLPPANPFLSTEPSLRYYYFAYILPGTVTNLSDGAITVTSGLVGLAVLIAFTFPYLIFDYGRVVGLSMRAALFATGLIVLVSGLDFFYVLEEHTRNGLWVEHIDFWANHDLRRINSISNMMIWTPQHVLGLVGFVFVLWFLHGLWTEQDIRYASLIAVVIAALAGTSSFVWFGMLVGMAGFIGIEGLRWLYKRENLRPLVMLIGAVILSLILSLPYLQVVGGREESAFAIEISPTVSGIKYGGIFSDLFGASTLTYILDFPFQMLVEFGLVLLIGLAGLWLIRRQWTTRIEVRLWMVLLIIFFLIVLVVRPARPDSNNYAARVAPMAWILLGILCGYWWMQFGNFRRWQQVGWIVAGLILLLPGLASTFYEPWIQQGPNYVRLLGSESGIERHNSISKEQHQVYRWLDEHLARDEVYQMGWESDTATYFVQRRAAVTAGYLALLYVSDDVLYYVDAIAPLQIGYGSDNPVEAAAALRHIEIDYLVTTPDVVLSSQHDPMFEEYFERVFATEHYQIYRVGGE